jgi:hypothetical protein
MDREIRAERRRRRCRTGERRLTCSELHDQLRPMIAAPASLLPDGRLKRFIPSTGRKTTYPALRARHFTDWLPVQLFHIRP